MEQGLVCIYDGTKSAVSRPQVIDVTVTVDIVAVHGLGAHRDYAWLRRRNVSSGIEQDVNWLIDLLPTTLQDSTPPISARIFCYNYDSRWLGKGLSTQRLTTLGDGLLDALDRKRTELSPDDARTRPLLFIAHSFGGLVVEKAIVRANVHGGHFQYLVDLVAGVVLLGTPHRGSSAQAWGSVIANAARVVHWGENGLLMDVAEGSMETEDLVHDFATIMIQKGLAESRAAVIFFETQKSDYGRRIANLLTWEEMVVPESSAKIFGFYPLSLDSDHFRLNKFGYAEEDNYRKVSGNIYRIAKQAPALLASRRQQPTQPRRYFEVPNRRVASFVGRAPA